MSEPIATRTPAARVRRHGRVPEPRNPWDTGQWAT
jgi:hypothetical protein